jgi:hypothetical protein
MNPARRNNDLARRDRLLHAVTLGEHAGNPAAVKEDAQHPRLTENFKVGARSRLRGQVAARAGGAFVVLTER